MTQRPVLVPVAAMSAIAATLTLGAGRQLRAGCSSGPRPPPACADRARERDGLSAGSPRSPPSRWPSRVRTAELFWGLTGTVLGDRDGWLLIGGLLRSNAALRSARAELAERAVAEERLRFARDLHDLLGHDLSLIAIKAELAGKLLPARVGPGDPRDRRHPRLDARRARPGARGVGGYRRPTLPREWTALGRRSRPPGSSCDVDGPGATLDPAVESVLAWAVREGTINAIRHSDARHGKIGVRPRRAHRAGDRRGRSPRSRPPTAGNGLSGLPSASVGRRHGLGRLRPRRRLRPAGELARRPARAA